MKATKKEPSSSSSFGPTSPAGAADQLPDQLPDKPDDSDDLALGNTYAAPYSQESGQWKGEGPPVPSEALFALSQTSAGEEPVFGEQAREVQPGTLINRYMVLSRLGAGGMGVVYAAFDTKLERKIAIKLLHHSASIDSTEGRARMLREAQVLAQLSHPNVVSIFDVGLHNDQVYICMEFIDGGTLTDWCAAQRREPALLLEFYIQAGRGLYAAHTANFIHRGLWTGAPQTEKARAAAPGERAGKVRYGSFRV